MQLPDSCIKVIEEYVNKNGEPTPYYRNLKRSRFLSKRYLIGKGSPSETKKYKVGVDCSGFVCHIIDGDKKIKKVVTTISNNPLKNLLFFFRPIENINVKTLIHPKNARNILTKNIKPGDLIHIGDEHVLIVYEVNHRIIYIAHSSEKKLATTTSKITIIDSTKSIGKQTWEDKYYHHKFMTIPNSGIKRLRHWL